MATDIRFTCLKCGQHLAISPKAAGQTIDCPACNEPLLVPSAPVPSAGPPPLPSPLDSSALPTLSNYSRESSASSFGRDASPFPSPVAAPITNGALTCPVCWLKFDTGDVMHVAVHDSLRGDPMLGEDAPQRFHATRFNDIGQALDAMGLPCLEIACPHCRRKFPAGFLDVPYHIISLVGDQSAGKSYYLSVLAKVLPASLYQHFGVTCQDADPSGNAPLNDMKSVLFSAQSPEQARLAKTQLEGAMYERLPRHGRIVALPKPFVYSLRANHGSDAACSLIFYDNAGEHFQPGRDMVEQPGALHVASAAGILFLFDPFNSPEFRARIRNTTDPQIEKPAIDQQDVILAEMRARIQKLQNLRSGQKIRTPVAVLVGKCDAWLHLLEGGALLNPLQSDALSLDSIRANSQRLRRFLLALCPTVVANAEALSEDVMFFAVSAFGHTPLKVDSNAFVPDPAQLAPVQVEVPPLWLLARIAPSLIATTL